jgi:hypothetical protein
MTGQAKQRRPGLLYGLLCAFILNAYAEQLTGIDLLATLGV